MVELDLFIENNKFVVNCDKLKNIASVTVWSYELNPDLTIF